MKTLECGCEQHQDTGTFMSLCFDHGQHMLMRKEAAKHPRTAPAFTFTNEPGYPHPAGEVRFSAGGAGTLDFRGAMERELIMRIAPVVLSKWNTVTDPQSSAEAIFQHVKEIMRRME